MSLVLIGEGEGGLVGNIILRFFNVTSDVDHKYNIVEPPISGQPK